MILKILEGVRNKLLPPSHLKELINRTSEERLLICSTCEFNKNNKCRACGCFLALKTVCLSCNCGLEKYNALNQTSLPLKWHSVATDEEDEEVKKLINENN